MLGHEQPVEPFQVLFARAIPGPFAGDFSFLRGVLMWVGVLAIAAIICQVAFNVELGTWFSIAMIAFAGGAILYDTSKVMYHYPEDRYVAASLELFASFALMLYYMVRLFMSRD